ncbi:MAG: hypothetical protein HY558_04920, partial [Euryarchaeota archaeon]|nr:hypothetical protein [Euryarchaeota archaeon]
TSAPSPFSPDSHELYDDFQDTLDKWYNVSGPKTNWTLEAGELNNTGNSGNPGDILLANTSWLRDYIVEARGSARDTNMLTHSLVVAYQNNSSFYVVQVYQGEFAIYEWTSTAWNRRAFKTVSHNQTLFYPLRVRHNGTEITAFFGNTTLRWTAAPRGGRVGLRQAAAFHVHYDDFLVASGNYTHTPEASKFLETLSENTTYFAVLRDASERVVRTLGSTGRDTVEKFDGLEETGAVVYYDERYRVNWVTLNQSRAVRDYLAARGFAIKNADELQYWMTWAINSSEAYTGTDRDPAGKTVVVMSQDICPDTVCQENSNTTLIRKYMDSGGRVVWIADVPFYYVGYRNNSNYGADSWDTWGYTGQSNLLDVDRDPLGENGATTQILTNGTLWGLTRTWPSSRPIFGQTITTYSPPLDATNKTGGTNGCTRTLSSTINSQGNTANGEDMSCSLNWEHIDWINVSDTTVAPGTPVTIGVQYRCDPNNANGWGEDSLSLAIKEQGAANFTPYYTSNCTAGGNQTYYTTYAPTTAGTLRIRASIDWQGNRLNSTPATTGGLTGKYFDRTNGGDVTDDEYVAATCRVISPTVNINIGDVAPSECSGVGNNDFNVRWTGRVYADCDASYTFYVTTDDGARLWVDGSRLVNSWTDQGATTYSGSITLTTGWHDIRMDSYENGGDYRAQLEYASSCFSRAIIPSTKLSPLWVTPMGPDGDSDEITLSVATVVPPEDLNKLANNTTGNNYANASAYQKKFNPTYPYSGFVRLWDYNIAALSTVLTPGDTRNLSDLYNVSVANMSIYTPSRLPDGAYTIAIGATDLAANLLTAEASNKQNINNTANTTSKGAWVNGLYTDTRVDDATNFAIMENKTDAVSTTVFVTGNPTFSNGGSVTGGSASDTNYNDGSYQQMSESCAFSFPYQACGTEFYYKFSFSQILAPNNVERIDIDLKATRENDPINVKICSSMDGTVCSAWSTSGASYSSLPGVDSSPYLQTVCSSASACDAYISSAGEMRVFFQDPWEGCCEDSDYVRIDRLAAIVYYKAARLNTEFTFNINTDPPTPVVDPANVSKVSLRTDAWTEKVNSTATTENWAIEKYNTVFGAWESLGTVTATTNAAPQSRILCAGTCSNYITAGGDIKLRYQDPSPSDTTDVLINRLRIDIHQMDITYGAPRGSVTVDTTPPTATLTQPLTNTTINTTVYTVQSSASDATSSVDRVLLAYSTDLGQNWTTLGNLLANEEFRNTTSGWTPVSGTWTNERDALHNENTTGGLSYTRADTTGYANATFRARVNIRNITNDSNPLVGLLIRGQGSALSGYFCGLGGNYTGNHYRVNLSRVTNGAFTQLATAEDTWRNIQGPRDIAIGVYDNSITCYIDGAIEASAADSTYTTANSAYLLNRYTHTDFDDAVLCNDDPVNQCGYKNASAYETNWNLTAIPDQKNIWVKARARDTINNDFKLYESAEHRATHGWLAYDNDPLGSITNQWDGTLQSRVINFSNYNQVGADQTGYVLGVPLGSGIANANSSAWNDPRVVAEWKFNTSEIYTFYVSVETPSGQKFITYDYTNSAPYTSGAGQYCIRGIGPGGGAWRTIRRNLREDLRDCQRDNATINYVHAFLVRMRGRLDDVRLLAEDVAANITLDTTPPQGGLRIGRVGLNVTGNRSIGLVNLLGSTCSLDKPWTGFSNTSYWSAVRTWANTNGWETEYINNTTTWYNNFSQHEILVFLGENVYDDWTNLSNYLSYDKVIVHLGGGALFNNTTNSACTNTSIGQPWNSRLGLLNGTWNNTSFSQNMRRDTPEGVGMFYDVANGSSVTVSSGRGTYCANASLCTNTSLMVGFTNPLRRLASMAFYHDGMSNVSGGYIFDIDEPIGKYYGNSQVETDRVLGWIVNNTTARYSHTERYTTTPYVNLSLQYGDALTNATQVRFTNNYTATQTDPSQWSPWYTPAALFSWNITDTTYGGNTSDGLKVVVAELQDGAGLSSFFGDAVYLDTTSPTVVLTVSPSAFAPHYNNSQNNTTITANFSETVDYTLRIIDPDGTTVVTKTGTGNSTSLQWWGELDGNATFQENFSTYTENQNDTAAPTWNIQAGNWQIQNGEYTMVGSACGSSTCYLSKAGDRNWTNYTLDGRIKVASGARGYLSVRLNNTSQARYDVGFFNPSKVEINRCTDLTTCTQVNNSTGSWQVGEFHTFNISTNGPQIRVWVDGRLELNYTDPAPFLNGSIGVASRGTSVFFDDINIRGATCTDGVYNVTVRGVDPVGNELVPPHSTTVTCSPPDLAKPTWERPFAKNVTATYYNASANGTIIYKNQTATLGANWSNNALYTATLQTNLSNRSTTAPEDFNTTSITGATNWSNFTFSPGGFLNFTNYTPGNISWAIRGEDTWRNTNTTDTLWFILKGWSTVSVTQPAAGSDFGRGARVRFRCTVSDQTNGSAIANYPVSFYWSNGTEPNTTSGLTPATDTTDSSGVAETFWYTNTSMAEGGYTLRCQIGNNTAAYYDATGTNASVGINLVGIETWLDEDWHYRIPVEINASSHDRFNQPIILWKNFTRELEKLSQLHYYGDFEATNNSWGDCTGSTSGTRDNATRYRGNQSYKVQATAGSSSMRCDVNPTGWTSTEYPVLTFGYRATANTPACIQVKNTSGSYITIAGTPACNPGFASNPADCRRQGTNLTADDRWHTATVDLATLTATCGNATPETTEFTELRTFTNANAASGSTLWLDEIKAAAKKLVDTAGIHGTFDNNSILLTEVNRDGTLLRDRIPIQFDPDTTSNNTTSATGELVWLLNGYTPANTSRYYHIYFDLLENGAKTPATYTTNLYQINRTAWWDDTLPAGEPNGDATWETDPDNVSYGNRSLFFATAGGIHSEQVQGLVPLSVPPGSILRTILYLDPTSLPSEVMLQFQNQSGSYDHRAFWGDNLVNTTNGCNTTRSAAEELNASCYYMGAIPAMGQWYAFDVPASTLRLEGDRLTGFNITFYGGQAWAENMSVYVPGNDFWVENDYYRVGMKNTSGGLFVTYRPRTGDDSNLAGTSAHRISYNDSAGTYYSTEYETQPRVTVRPGPLRIRYTATGFFRASDSISTGNGYTVTYDFYDNTTLFRVDERSNISIKKTLSRFGNTEFNWVDSPNTSSSDDEFSSLGSNFSWKYPNGTSQTSLNTQGTGADHNFTTNSTVWWDDTVPGKTCAAGCTLTGTWTWAGTPLYNGSASVTSGAAWGAHNSTWTNTSGGSWLNITAQSILQAWVYLNPADPPREILLAFNASDSSSWEHRAYWGEDLLDGGIVDNTSRRYMGPLPATGRWVRLEIPALLLGLENRSVNGLNMSLFDGQAWFDRMSLIHDPLYIGLQNFKTDSSVGLIPIGREQTKEASPRLNLTDGTNETMFRRVIGANTTVIFGDWFSETFYIATWNRTLLNLTPNSSFEGGPTWTLPTGNFSHVTDAAQARTGTRYLRFNGTGLTQSVLEATSPALPAEPGTRYRITGSLWKDFNYSVQDSFTTYTANTTGAPNWTVLNGTWQANDSGNQWYNGSATNWSSKTVIGNLSWTNLTVAVRIQLKNGTTAGVALRQNSAHLGYIVNVSAGGDWIRVYNETCRCVVAQASVALENDTWYDMAVSATGRVIAGLINGTTVAYTDANTTYASRGRTGLVTGDTTYARAYFDNIVAEQGGIEFHIAAYDSGLALLGESATRAATPYSIGDLNRQWIDRTLSFLTPANTRYLRAHAAILNETSGEVRMDDITITREPPLESLERAAHDPPRVYQNEPEGYGPDVVFYEAPLNTTRGALNLTLRAYVRNTGTRNLNDPWLNWTLPPNWTLSSGSLNYSYSGTLAFGDRFWNNITVTVETNATLGYNLIRVSSNATTDTGTYMTDHEARNVLVFEPTAEWWNPTWPYRVPIILNSSNYTRTNYTAVHWKNFSLELAKLGIANQTFDPNSIRVVEYNNTTGDVLWETVSQWDQDVIGYRNRTQEAFAYTATITTGTNVSGGVHSTAADDSSGHSIQETGTNQVTLDHSCNSMDVLASWGTINYGGCSDTAQEGGTDMQFSEKNDQGLPCGLFVSCQANVTATFTISIDRSAVDSLKIFTDIYITGNEHASIWVRNFSDGDSTGWKYLGQSSSTQTTQTLTVCTTTTACNNYISGTGTVTIRYKDIGEGIYDNSDSYKIDYQSAQVTYKGQQLDASYAFRDDHVANSTLKTTDIIQVDYVTDASVNASTPAENFYIWKYNYTPTNPALSNFASQQMTCSHCGTVTPSSLVTANTYTQTDGDGNSVEVREHCHRSFDFWNQYCGASFEFIFQPTGVDPASINSIEFLTDGENVNEDTASIYAYRSGSGWGSSIGTTSLPGSPLQTISLCTGSTECSAYIVNGIMQLRYYLPEIGALTVDEDGWRIDYHSIRINYGGTAKGWENTTTQVPTSGSPYTVNICTAKNCTNYISSTGYLQVRYLDTNSSDFVDQRLVVDYQHMKVRAYPTPIYQNWSGEFVWFVNGTTLPQTERTFHVYFDTLEHTPIDPATGYYTGKTLYTYPSPDANFTTKSHYSIASGDLTNISTKSGLSTRPNTTGEVIFRNAYLRGHTDNIGGLLDTLVINATNWDIFGNTDWETKAGYDDSVHIDGGASPSPTNLNTTEYDYVTLWTGPLRNSWVYRTSQTNYLLEKRYNITAYDKTVGVKYNINNTGAGSHTYKNFVRNFNNNSFTNYLDIGTATNGPYTTCIPHTLQNNTFTERYLSGSFSNPGHGLMWNTIAAPGNDKVECADGGTSDNLDISNLFRPDTDTLGAGTNRTQDLITIATTGAPGALSDIYNQTIRDMPRQTQLDPEIQALSVIVTTPSIVHRGSDETFTGMAINVLTRDLTNVNLTWVLPANWTIVSGSATQLFSTVKGISQSGPGETVTNDIVVHIPENETLGANRTITFLVNYEIDGVPPAQPIETVRTAQVWGYSKVKWISPSYGTQATFGTNVSLKCEVTEFTYSPGLVGRYYNILNPGQFNATSVLALTRQDPNASFYWSGSPGAGVNAENFTVEWNGRLYIGEDYDTTFTLGAGSGETAGLYIDNVLILTKNSTQTTNTTLWYLTPGYHTLRLTYNETTGNANITLAWDALDGVRRNITATNLSSQLPIASYPTDFYNNTVTFLGNNSSDAHGYVNGTLRAQKGGDNYVSCHVGDNSTLYYNASVESDATSLIFIQKLQIQAALRARLWTESGGEWADVYFDGNRAPVGTLNNTHTFAPLKMRVSSPSLNYVTIPSDPRGGQAMDLEGRNPNFLFVGRSKCLFTGTIELLPPVIELGPGLYTVFGIWPDQNDDQIFAIGFGNGGPTIADIQAQKFAGKAFFFLGATTGAKETTLTTFTNSTIRVLNNTITTIANRLNTFNQTYKYQQISQLGREVLLTLSLFIDQETRINWFSRPYTQQFIKSDCVGGSGAALFGGLLDALIDSLAGSASAETGLIDAYHITYNSVRDYTEMTRIAARDSTVKPYAEGLFRNIARRSPDMFGPNDGTNGLTYLLNGTFQAPGSYWDQFVNGRTCGQGDLNQYICGFWDWLDSLIEVTARLAKMFPQAFPDSGTYNIQDYVDDKLKRDAYRKEFGNIYWSELNNQSNVNETAKKTWNVVYWTLRNLNKAADKSQYTRIQPVATRLMANDTKTCGDPPGSLPSCTQGTHSNLWWMLGNLDGTDGQETYKMKGIVEKLNGSLAYRIGDFTNAYFDYYTSLIRFAGQMGRELPNAFPPS